MSANEKSFVEQVKEAREKAEAEAEQKKAEEEQKSYLQKTMDYVKENPKKSIAAALVVGYVAGVSVNASGNSGNADYIADQEKMSRERLGPKKK